MSADAVLIVGGGPTGLMLAAELALAGVPARVLERRPNQDLAGSRAGGLHARTLEIFDQRGIVDRFLAAGSKAQVAGFSMIPLDISDFPTRHNYGLALWQNEIERILAGWVRELGVPVEYGTEVTALVAEADAVRVDCADGRRLRAPYLVGCDGGRSVVRKLAGIDFVGTDPTTSTLIAEVAFAEEGEWGIRRTALGINGLSKLEHNGAVRVLLTEREIGHRDEPTLEHLREELVAVYGRDFGVHSPIWISRFTDATRQAASYRAGRVFLAGDAAHIHPPDGGQGLQLGVQDAVNLGWKLALALRGEADDSLLDTYHAERHPVAARALQGTLASVALRRADDRTNALRATMTELLALDAPRRHLAGTLSGLELRYALGDGHPLLGRRMPDLHLETADGPRRVFDLLHDARPLYLEFAPGETPDFTRWGTRLQRVAASTTAAWELPVLGAIEAPRAVLVRPDGYVAWVGLTARSVG